MRVAPEHDAPVGPNRWPAGALYMDHQREGRDEKCAPAFRSLFLVATGGAGWLLPDSIENRPPIRAWASLRFGGAGVARCPFSSGRPFCLGAVRHAVRASPLRGMGLGGSAGPAPGPATWSNQPKNAVFCPSALVE